jgi:NHLM bacteriocin system ABC transporter ATP-binding protein
MGWFDEQIHQRKQLDDIALADACAEVNAAITGKRNAALHLDDASAAKNAIEEILRYYHIPLSELPKEVTELDAQLEYFMHPYGVMRRDVVLSSGWYKDAVGVMLGKKSSDGSPVALIPGKAYGYSYFDAQTGKTVRLNKKTEQQISPEAIYFYTPFPQEKLGIPALVKYIFETTSPGTIAMFAVLTLLITLMGLLLPKINYLLFSDVIESKSPAILLAIAFFSLSVSISTLLISAVKALVTSRLNTQLSLSVQSATMARLFSLPADFFKKYSAGELSAKTGYINQLCSSLVSGIFSVGLTSLFSVIYITQIFEYTPTLVVPALSITGITILTTIVITLKESKHRTELMRLSAKESGMTYALISGVQKIKLAGAEKRAFSRWLGLYAKSAKLSYNPPKLLMFSGVISTAISLVGSLVMYWAAIQSGVNAAEYYAFNTAYGMVSGAFMSLVGIASTIAAIKPILTEAKPLLETVPEVTAGKRMVTRLGGTIELNNVTFRYTDSMPPVVDNLSLKIKNGQYVAIVGKTGCGKSTLMRLLLGFETPQRGAVYYDGKDINSLDLKSLRRSIGTVMQNGKLFSGSIQENILVTAPNATLQDAWEAAEIVGIAEDIRQMPMGMQTMISEGSGGVSGGQRQRLLIARAIVPKPKILMFDEATSALDNITQKQVSEALDSLKCTRIVIAHRLSTIRQCDRVIVLDGGKIAEDGSYEELLQKDGLFAELVKRQLLDTTQYIGKTTVY